MGFSFILIFFWGGGGATSGFMLIGGAPPICHVIWRNEMWASEGCLEAIGRKGRAQTSLENAKIANMNSPETQLSYFSSDALFNVIQLPTQNLIRSKTRLQTPTARALAVVPYVQMMSNFLA